METVQEATIVWSLWGGTPASVKFGWLLLAGGAIALAFCAYALHRQDSGLARYPRAAVLLARIAALAAVALCMWGLGNAVVESGNSIDTPRALVVENIAIAEGRAFLVLKYFISGAAIVVGLSYVLEYWEHSEPRHPGRQ